MPNRPARRTLVRWNDDHDKELLLWINYCCAEQGIKIPFARVAQCMGPSFTEGACVQHLAKIRNRMDAVGLHVPPAQKRGTITKAASSVYRQVLKPIDAPPPRIRPADQDGSQEDGYFDDEEEEPEDHSPSKNASGRRGSKHTTYRQAKPRKGPVDLKHDSSEDDPIPQSELDRLDNMLYDSDNEYGAKKAKGSPEGQKTAGQKVQMKIRFGGQQNAAQSGNRLSNIGGYDNDGFTKDFASPQANQHSPSLKYETLEDGLADIGARLGSIPSQTRGTRRKSSAMAADDEDEEYEPETKPKSRGKKVKAGRTPKKQKVSPKKDHIADKQKTSAAVAGYQEANVYDVDRAAMPPPSLPNASAPSAFAWNNSFMHQPFGPHVGQGIGLNSVTMSDGSFNDISPPAADHFANFDRLTAAALSANYNGSPYIGGGYLPTDTDSTFRTAQSRNPSFASTSTVDTQPASWNRTLNIVPTDTWNTPAHRHPFFRTPQEASRALHAKTNDEDHSDGAKNDATSVGGLTLGDPFDYDAQQTKNNVGAHNEGEADSLFVEASETVDDDIVWSDWINEEYLS